MYYLYITVGGQHEIEYKWIDFQINLNIKLLKRWGKDFDFFGIWIWWGKVFMSHYFLIYFPPKESEFNRHFGIFKFTYSGLPLLQIQGLEFSKKKFIW